MDERRAWIWLFPLSQALHATEERLEGYGFHAWLRSRSHEPFSPQQTEIMHVAFVIGMLLICWLAIRFSAAAWMVVGLGALILLNAASHLVGAFLSSSARSGLITSVLFWVPLGIYTLIRTWRHLDRRQFWIGCAAGALVEIPITWLAVAAH